jgi:predicted NACHT family NTPase
MTHPMEPSQVIHELLARRTTTALQAAAMSAQAVAALAVETVGAPTTPEDQSTAYITESDAVARLAAHLKDAARWSAQMSFSDLRSPRPFSQFFIELDVHQFQTLHSPQDVLSTERISISDALTLQGHHVLLGSPGSGKTTAFKWHYASLLEKLPAEPTTAPVVPVVFKLGDLTSRSSEDASLFDLLKSILPFKAIALPSISVDLPNGLKVAADSVVYATYLNELHLEILLDGLDELPATARRRVIAEFEWLATRLTKSRLLLSCRTGAWASGRGQYHTWEIAPLTTEQMNAAAVRWFTSQREAEGFARLLSQASYSDAARSPLLLAHLAAIYERIGLLPERPASVYRRLTNLLLEEWDGQRGIRRASKYAEFNTDRKHGFLCHLAFTLTAADSEYTFSHKTLVAAYSGIADQHGLPRFQADAVVREIESHSGLLVEVAHGRFEFSHKSLKEYLAAEFIVHSPTLVPYVTRFDKFTQEFAIATALSSNASQFFTMLMLEVAQVTSTSSRSVNAFLERLRYEKPIFYPNEDYFLGAFIASCMSGRDDLTQWLFASSTTRTTWAAISKYYRIADRDGARVSFVCRTKHPGAKLPFTLTTDLPFIISLLASASDA